MDKKFEKLVLKHANKLVLYAMAIDIDKKKPISFKSVVEPIINDAFDAIHKSDFEDASIKTTEGNHTITGGNIGKFVEGK